LRPAQQVALVVGFLGRRADVDGLLRRMNLLQAGQRRP
jgi:hypothetical protein